MRLISSRRSLENRQMLEHIAGFIVSQVMPEADDAFTLIDDSVERIDLGFQESFNPTGGQHVHEDVVLSGWSGSWGRFCTLVLDPHYAKLKVWAGSYTEVDVSLLDTRDGKIALGAAVESAILNREKHSFVLATEYDRLPTIGLCRDRKVLTVVYQLQKKSAKQLSIIDRIDRFLGKTIGSRKTSPRHVDPG